VLIFYRNYCRVKSSCPFMAHDPAGAAQEYIAANDASNCEQGISRASIPGKKIVSKESLTIRPVFSYITR